jgi:hypothetical protein
MANKAVDIQKFLNDFVEEWNGKYLNVNGAPVNFDGRYGIQCMDLWNYWWTELGLPVVGFPRHADAAGVWEDFKGKHYEYFDGILPSQPAKPGDVFIYNRKAWGTGYGHIGIVIRDNSNGTITVLETNGLNDGWEDDAGRQYGSPARIHIWPKTNLYGYLRYIQPKPVIQKEVDFLAALTEKEQKELLSKTRFIYEALQPIKRDVNKDGKVEYISVRQEIADIKTEVLKPGCTCK